MASAFERLAWMISGGEMPPAATTSVRLPGTAISIAHRKMKPTMKAAATEPSTARGATRRGSFVSSASVEAVSKP